MSNSKSLGLKIIASIVILLIGYHIFVKPISEANTELEVKYINATISKSPIEIESRLKGKLRTRKYFEIKTNEYWEFDFIVSHKYCSPLIVDIPKGSNVKLGISLEDYQKTVTRKPDKEDEYWNIINVFEIIHMKNDQEMVMYLNKEIEESRRLAFRKYLYPFSIITYILLLTIIFYWEE